MKTFLFLTSLVLLTACSSSPEQNIIGRWKPISLYGVDSTSSKDYFFRNARDYKQIFEFNKEGKFNYYQNGELKYNLEFTLASDGKSILVKDPTFGHSMPIKIISLSGNKMEAVTEVGYLSKSDTVIFIKSKTGTFEKEEKQIAERADKVDVEENLAKSFSEIKREINRMIEDIEKFLPNVDEDESYTIVNNTLAEIKKVNLTKEGFSNEWSTDLVSVLKRLVASTPNLKNRTSKQVGYYSSIINSQTHRLNYAIDGYNSAVEYFNKNADNHGWKERLTILEKL